MSLTEYQRKRDFAKTKEPAAAERLAAPRAGAPLRFTIQKHAARRLHYDLRLEHEGALLSWAVPKGPSLDPSEKRLAVRVEDHPLEYASFEGTIPAGEYGGGTVMVWDTGSWIPDENVARALKKGRLTFELSGEKLQGRWHLARMRGGQDDNENWLLIKSKDDFAVSSDQDTALDDQPLSALTRRSLEEITAGKPGQSKPKPAPKPSARSQSSSNGKRSNNKSLPESLSPQLATLAETMPTGEEWIHEIKYDGYRLLAFCNGESITLRTRNQHDWTGKFPTIRDALKKLRLDNCILDGEAVAIDKNGVSNFQALQNALKGGRSGEHALRFMVFDLPFALGNDLRAEPLAQRKQLLKELLAKVDSEFPAQYSDHFRGAGDALFRNACELNLEGIVSKDEGSRYVSKRSRSWLKIKCQRRQEFIVCGFTAPSNGRVGFGALRLAFYDSGGSLRYAGKVGTGFDTKALRALKKQFAALAISDSPLSDLPADKDKTTWIKPELVAEIKYAERTNEGLLRQAVFLGMREDKPASAVRWEGPAEFPDADAGARSRKSKAAQPADKTNSKRMPKPTKTKAKANAASDVAGIAITHPDRILYPSIGADKLRLASYYEAVAESMLPYVARRPLSLLRHPQGIGQKGFFQKHIDDSFPAAVKQVQIAESDGEGDSVYGYVDSADGLVGLLQMGVLEIHAWNCRIDKVEQPDQFVMDLDPDDSVSSEAVVGAALMLRDLLLEEAGLQSFLKTTGGKGLHLVVPLRRGPSWSVVKAFSKAIAEALRERSPSAFTTTASKAKRKGKIYIDYLRNSRGATAIAPFSTRARPGATVAVPLAWDEAIPGLTSNQYTIDNTLRRLAQLKRDPWADMTGLNQSLRQATLQRFGVD